MYIYIIQNEQCRMERALVNTTNFPTSQLVSAVTVLKEHVVMISKTDVTLFDVT